MARIAVLHNTLDLRGGADAVCLHACEALARDHDVTLFTLSRTPLAELNALFDTDADVSVRRPPGVDPLSRALDAAAAWAGPQLPARSALLRRWFLRHVEEFDTAVSTANEFGLPIPSVQYVHFPQFNGAATPAASAGRLNGLWSHLGGVGDRTLPADATLLTNSAWTADVVEGIYGRRPSVCFPPVDPVPTARPWGEREEGIVTLGRLAPDKRPLRAVEVVDAVRERGHDLHLHVVGSAPRAYRSYVRRVEAAAAERPYVTVERDASRERVETLLGTHRYALGTKPEEHFGMALAESVAAGMLAFAPASGGQREVLDGQPELLYADVDDAAEKLAAAVEADRRPTLPRDRFGRERFHRAIREAVEGVR
jgi:glycosyltransferase involved in cell wall biosynthesis